MSERRTRGWLPARGRREQGFLEARLPGCAESRVSLRRGRSGAPRAGFPGLKRAPSHREQGFLGARPPRCAESRVSLPQNGFISPKAGFPLESSKYQARMYCSRRNTLLSAFEGPFRARIYCSRRRLMESPSGNPALGEFTGDRRPRVARRQGHTTTAEPPRALGCG